MNCKIARPVFGMIALVLVLHHHPLAAQEARHDSLWQVDLPNVVVTATKGAKERRNVPVPTQVITCQDMAAQGARRLSDLLAEQTGLALVYDLGTGIQVQGLDAAYTLIDGEPVIGRQGGTLDLERLTLADIERVEIVRGPSSSLYGSEALAGVIKLITRQPEMGFRAHSDIRYQTHDTVDLTASAEVKGERFGARFLVNRYSSGGYDLTPIPGRVLVIRTADGTYAKVRILSYYKGAPETPDAATDEARYYTFEFLHQPDGSRVLE